MKPEDARKDFKLFIEQKRSWYKKVGKIFCPVLNEHVVFNAKGFYHLRYDGLGNERSREQQVSRMDLLYLSIEIIRLSREVSEYRKQDSQSNRGVQYWALERSISKKWKVVLILRKIGTGQVTFYSTWKKKVK